MPSIHCSGSVLCDKGDIESVLAQELAPGQHASKRQVISHSWSSACSWEKSGTEQTGWAEETPLLYMNFMHQATSFIIKGFITQVHRNAQGKVQGKGTELPHLLLAATIPESPYVHQHRSSQTSILSDFMKALLQRHD